MPPTKPVPSIAEQLAAHGFSLGDLTFAGQVPLSRNKFYAESVDDPEDGYFASRLEHSTWVDLKRRQHEGEIEALQRQVGFSIWIKGVWICDCIWDFVFIENGVQIVADAKGKVLDTYLMKARLMRACYGIVIREYTKDGIAPERKFRVEKEA